MRCSEQRRDAVFRRCLKQGRGYGKEEDGNTRMGNKFLITQIWIRKGVGANLQNLEELAAKLHDRAGVRVTWFVLPDIFTEKPELIDRILCYRDQYGDDFTFDIGCPLIVENQETVSATIDQCMAHMKRLTGSYPSIAGGWFLNAGSISHLKAEYGVEIVVGQMWEQFGVDGFSGLGSINGPYFPSSNHSLVPASEEKNRLDVVVLDTLSADVYDTKFPKCARATVHPWDSNLTAGDGVTFQKYISDCYWTDNACRNQLSVLNLRFELDWINQTTWCYNQRMELKERVFDFWDSIAIDHPDVALVSLSEFNNRFRQEHQDNGRLLYRYHHRSKYDPNAFIYWYFNKNHAVAVEYRTSAHDGPETIVLTNLDFRKQGKWQDGYDVAEYDRAVYPETRVRTTPIVGNVDTATFPARGGRYTAWILSDGTAAGDIEVKVDGASLGIAAGTRGVDGWCTLGDLELTPGDHQVELIHVHNPQSNWYATYVEVLLTQERDFTPAKNRIIDKDGFVAVTNYVIYDDNLRESVPPASDFSVTNGLNWKLKGVMTETFIVGERRMAIHSQCARLDGAKVLTHDMGITRLAFDDRKVIPFSVDLLDFTETEDTATFAWRFHDGETELLKKSVTITAQHLIIDYGYSQSFDRLEIEDAFGGIHVLDCPRQVVFKDGLIESITKAY